MQPIQVYSLPPHLLTSPYLDQLYGSINDPGVQVRHDRPRRAIPVLLFGRGPRVLHLHFFDELTQRPGMLATTTRSLLFVLLLVVLRLRGVRLIWTAHNLKPHESYHSFWAAWVYSMAVRLSTAVIAHSAAAKTMLEARYGPMPHATVIPHGSYIGLYGPVAERAASRAALGLPADGPVLLNIGTLRPYKHLESLIEAFAALPVASRGTLLIAGGVKSAVYAEALQTQAASVPGVVLRPQHIPDKELPRYFAAVDAVVLPYASLLTSGVLLWALSYARPVVAPAFGPVLELVREGHEGWLFEPNDTASLCSALGRALAAPDRERMGHNALAVAEQFDWPSIAAQTAQVYRRSG